MKRYGSLIFFFLACAVLLLSFYGDESYSQVGELRKSLAWQQDRNGEALDHLEDLRRQVAGLQNDDRTLERAARDKLGMVKPDDLVILFEKKANR